MADKLFTLGRDTNTIYGYKMNTPDDLSTLVYDYGNSFRLNYQEEVTINFGTYSYWSVFYFSDSYVKSKSFKRDVSIGGAALNATGTKLIVGYQDIKAYDLSTAWDVSTASEVASATMAISGQYVKEIRFYDNGNKMIVTCSNSGTVENSIFQYNLSTAYDINTASLSYEFNPSEFQNIDGAYVREDDMSKLYVYRATTLCTYTLTTPGDLSTAVYYATNTLQNIDTGFGSSSPSSIFVSSTGDKAIVHGALTVFGTLSTPYDLTTLTFSEGNSIYTLKDSEDTNTYFSNVFAKSDFSKIYVTGQVAKKINQIDVNFTSVSSATYQAIINCSEIEAFDFNADGTKLYVSSPGSVIFQFNLSTPYDLLTASYSGYKYFENRDWNIYDMRFANDGTTNYLTYINQTRYRTVQHFPNNSDDMSSFVGLSRNYMSGIEPDTSFTYANDGFSVFFITSSQGNDVKEHYMNSAYALNGSYATGNIFSVSGQDATGRGVEFNSNGTKMYILGSSNDQIYQYSTQVNPVGGYVTDISSFSLSNIPTVAYNKADLTTTEIAYGDTGRCLPCDHEIIDVQSATNTQMVYNEHTDRVPDVGDLFTFYHSSGSENQTLDSVSGVNIAASPISGASYDNVNFSVGSQDTGPYGITFNNDGTKMYMVGVTNDRVHQYSLSTAFDLSTCSYDNVFFSVASQDTNPSGIAFNNDGTKMYMVGNDNDSVHQYSLSTAFDLSTCSYDSVNFSVASQETYPFDITFNNDGTKMYMVGITTRSVYQYSLSTAFDLSTCSYDSVNFSVASQDTSPTSITFNNDGTKMYMVGVTNDRVHQYSLSTAFDLSTCSYDNVFFSVGSQDASPYGIRFSNDGTKMYMVGYTNKSVYQYSVNGSINNITQYTVTYPAISQAPDTTYGNPLMKARRTALTPSGYTLSAGDVVLTYDKVALQGREIAFRHDIKNIDDLVKVTKFDLEKLQ